MSRGGTILVIEDEEDIAAIVRAYLERDGFRVVWATRGTEGLAALEQHDVRLAILDLQLPDADGFDVCRAIRSSSRLPIVMLTARDEEVDRVAGLELGADDYVTKPFSPREIVARVRAVLRRAGSDDHETAGEDPLEVAGLRIDPRSREVRVADDAVSLTPKEFDMLYLMASQPRTVFSRPALLEEVWDIAFDGDPSTVTVHIRRLREKIESDPSRPRHLVTVWGAGYRFDP